MPLAEYNVRIGLVAVCFLAMFGGLAAWLHHLQVDRHDEFLAKAKQVYTQQRTRRGNRGNICDREGNVLAGTENCMDVMVEPRRIPPTERDAVITTLARLYTVDEKTLRQRFGSDQVEVVVERGVDYQRAVSLQNHKIPGVRFLDSQRRYYPKGSLAIHMLGFLREGKGVYGIEKVCDDWLQPLEGTITFERDRRGSKRLDKREAARTPLDGKDIYLTISEPLQHVVEAELANLVREWQPRYAYAIMADPKTGAIMAMAQIPTFDPNDRSTMKPAAWQNHAVSDVYEPGSTMKSVSICGALDYGVVNLTSEFYCEKGLWFYVGKPLRDSGHAYEWLTIEEIVMHSSNIGTAKASIQVGEARMNQIFLRFGFGQKTGIELPHESRGIYRRVSKWDNLSITRFPIGQGIAVTPFQMVQAYCALANGGEMMQVHLIDRVIDPNTGEVMFRNIPKFKRTVAKPSAVYDIVQAMKRVVSSDGTASKAAVPGYEVAGKTGTSQKWDNARKTYESGRYFASFIGFVPADDPAFVLLVVADEPQRKHYGGTVCAPTFSRISAEALRYLNVVQNTASSR